MSVVVNEQTVFTNITTHARTDENSKLNLNLPKPSQHFSHFLISVASTESIGEKRIRHSDPTSSLSSCPIYLHLQRGSHS